MTDSRRPLNPRFVIWPGGPRDDGAFDERRQQANERVRRVQRGGAPQFGAAGACSPRGLDVDVEQDLRVVAHEADWHHQEAPDT